MEVDTMITHGVSCILRENMLFKADLYETFVCRQCGILAIANEKKNLFYCRVCNTKANVAKIKVPYAFVLLSAELQAMNVLLKLKV